MAKQSKKNNIQLKVIRGNKISNPPKPDVELYKAQVLEGKKIDKMVRPALLISRVDYPVTVEYDNKHIRVSPRAKEVIADVNRLQKELPKGLILKK